LLCIGSADGTVHLLAPLVAIWRGDWRGPEPLEG
jgi:hypothetical protein